MLLVGERFGLEVPSSPGEVRERLERVPAAFTGTVSDDAFRLSGVLGYRNAFAPIAHGSFRTGVAGTRVDVKLRLRPAVAVFTPERVFNRVFLAAFGISGILSVLAWDQLATACSNGESRQPERFACPGDSRFVLTWSLVVLVVGACWGSRLALHRKARRSYLPLVVLVVLAGAVAGWLMTHHPRWGVPRATADETRARQDSNLRPAAPEAAALSPELRARGTKRSVDR
jgi:hypothetical protein